MWATVTQSEREIVVPRSGQKRGENPNSVFYSSRQALSSNTPHVFLFSFSGWPLALVRFESWCVCLFPYSCEIRPLLTLRHFRHYIVDFTSSIQLFAAPKANDLVFMTCENTVHGIARHSPICFFSSKHMILSPLHFKRLLCLKNIVFFLLPHAQVHHMAICGLSPYHIPYLSVVLYMVALFTQTNICTVVYATS